MDLSNMKKFEMVRLCVCILTSSFLVKLVADLFGIRNFVSIFSAGFNYFYMLYDGIIFFILFSLSYYLAGKLSVFKGRSRD